MGNMHLLYKKKQPSRIISHQHRGYETHGVIQIPISYQDRGFETRLSSINATLKVSRKNTPMVSFLNIRTKIAISLLFYPKSDNFFHVNSIIRYVICKNVKRIELVYRVFYCSERVKI